MNTNVKLVMVEHDPNDIELIKRELKKGTFHYEIEVVRSALPFEDALKNFRPDIILSDYSLPSFSGSEAFKIREKLAPLIPFIFVSGTIGEENSIEYIKNGVTDYVLKDRLFSLNVKVKRALKEAKEQKLKKEAEEEKEFDQNNLKALLNNTHDLIWSVDKNFKLITSNEAFDRMAKKRLGHKIESGDYILAIPDNEDQLNRFKQRYERAFSGEIFSEFEYTPSPIEFWSEVSFYPIYKNLVVVGAACFSKNITKQRKAEDHLRLLESVITNTNDAIIITEGDPIDQPGPKIVFVNDAFTNMTGYSKAEVLGKSPRFLQGPKTERHQLDKIRKAIQMQQSIEVEIINYKKNGEEFWNNFTIVPVTNSLSRHNHYVSIQRDATSRKLSEEIIRMRLESEVEVRTRELNDALAKEKQLVELKNNFISVASHEFRTPLSTISMATGFVRKYQQKLTPLEIDTKLASIEKQISQMTYLLEDVLLLGKASAGKMSLKLAEVDIHFFENLAQEVIFSSGTNNQLRIKNTCDKKSITTDEKCIRAIVINLITNAIKFSPGGSAIIMNLSCDDQHLYLSIKDTGIGIPHDDVQHLFTSFSRGSNVGAIQGTGLGLSIIKNACDFLNGKIQVTSVEGKGTEFIITLPLRYV